jgi:hypothetical protein
MISVKIKTQLRRLSDLPALVDRGGRNQIRGFEEFDKFGETGRVIDQLTLD